MTNMQNPFKTSPQEADHPGITQEAEVTVLREENQQLKDERDALKHRVAWFENQIFGQKSEKRIIDNPLQGNLLTDATETAPEPEQTSKVAEHARGKAKKQRAEDCVTDSRLRFSDEVPVEVIEVVPEELKGDDADQYEIIGTKVTHKLAQVPASYVALEYRIPVIKHKSNETVKTTAMPDQVLDASIADVSLIVGLLIDKFQYHLPLHRQHQRMTQGGINVARASLTNWTQRGIELLRPIVEAMLVHVLQSKVLAMDETPIKAGKKQKGKMKQGYFWPIYGEDDEIVFTYNNSRGKQHIIETLTNKFSGTLVTDGYAAYARYAE